MCILNNYEAKSLFVALLLVIHTNYYHGNKCMAYILYYMVILKKKPDFELPASTILPLSWSSSIHTLKPPSGGSATSQQPFQAHRFEVMNKTKYIHLTVILLGLFLPLIPVVVSFATGGFDFVRFPPIVCTAASRTATFYSLVSPTAIAAATGLMLLVLIFWTTSKVNYAILRSLEPRPSPNLREGGGGGGGDRYSGEGLG